MAGQDQKRKPRHGDDDDGGLALEDLEKPDISEVLSKASKVLTNTATEQSTSTSKKDCGCW